MQWHTFRPHLVRTITALLVALVVGVLVGLSFNSLFACLPDEHTLLNPLLRCQRDSSQAFVGEYEDFEVELTEWIERQKEAGVVSDVAVYFRDLNAGPWFGINERAEFVPSSLFKLPLLIAVLRASTTVPGLLEEQTSLSGAYVGIQNIADPNQTVVPSRDYSVMELLYKMIVYSDNASQYMLQQILHAIDPTDAALRRVYQDLGILNFYEKETLTVKAYASLFRVLYNARYLSPELSTIALDLLAQSTFEDGLERGIPPGIIVAHKFGVRDVQIDAGLQQLHDCGIVYHPKRPYLICIMTIGSDNLRSSELIGSISRRVYEAVEERVGS